MKDRNSFSNNFLFTKIGKKLKNYQFFNDIDNSIIITALQLSTAKLFSISPLLFFNFQKILILYSFIMNKKHTFCLNNFNYLNKMDIFKEYIINSTINFKLNQIITNETIKIGQTIKISALSIGKGFSGNLKRHNFNRGPESHGSKHHRLQGSLGSGTTPGRTIPGKRMSGRLGYRFNTNINTSVFFVNPKTNIIFVKGSVPGKFGNFLYIK